MSTKEKINTIIASNIKSDLEQISFIKNLMNNEMPKMLRQYFTKALADHQADIKEMMTLKRKLLQ